MKLRISVEGKAYDVDVEVLEEGNAYAAPSYTPRSAAPAPAPAPRAAPMAPPAAPSAPAAGGSGERVVKAPIVGTVMQVKVKPGDNVEVNQVLLVMEAMKMETNIASPVPGRVKTVLAAPGDAVKAGQILVELE
jgi:glutaconyl-CoA/methylmalonyl-CoA decarboxylase subunit gamma